MRILIIGAGGMIGGRLAQKLVDAGALGERPINAMCLTDVVRPVPLPANFNVETYASDLRNAKDREKMLAFSADVIFNLAAVVSGQAEANYELGMEVNVLATATFLNDIRLSGKKPIVVGTSSIAVYGGLLPDIVPDHFRLTPQSSYGTQKAIVELLMGDHARRGHFDARNVRLPTITVRPGKPNKAASSFVSGIIREPLNGQATVLPVPQDTEMWVASPDCAVKTLLHLATLPAGVLPPGVTVSGRGLTVSVSDMLAALERVGGKQAVKLVHEIHDRTISSIVGSWPKALDCREAAELGFPIDESVDTIIHAYSNEIAV